MPHDIVVRLATTAETSAWIADGDASARLLEAEARSDLVLVAVGADGGANREVLRQADLVLVAVDSATPRRATAAVIDAQVRPTELLVCGPRGTRPREVGAATAVSHVEVGNAENLERLARRLTGRAVGLVLGGGGARGFAHIGAVRAIREAGIPIDRVGGSSMGAIIGAQVAMGWSTDEMLERNRRWSRWLVAEPTIPTVALARGTRAAELIRSFFAGLDIEDLPLEFFCTTADLTTYSLHIATRGPVAQWVAASAAVPGFSTRSTGSRRSCSACSWCSPSPAR